MKGKLVNQNTNVDCGVSLDFALWYQNINDHLQMDTKQNSTRSPHQNTFRKEYAQCTILILCQYSILTVQ